MKMKTSKGQPCTTCLLFKVDIGVFFLTLLLVAGLSSPVVSQETSALGNIPNHSPDEDQVLGSPSEPEAVAVAEPNLGTLLSNASPSGILQGGVWGTNSPLLNSGGRLKTSEEERNLCGGVTGPNSDALTNLLVYQYLSGSLSQSGANSQNSGVGGNPQLQALLDGATDLKTATTVARTITTRTVTLEASTRFLVSSTTYVTTVTTLKSSVLPIIFRGSKLTTTITDKLTDVVTATEFFTSSSVLTPSIVQTLPLEITFTQTSTRGINGHYTLAHTSPGGFRVIEQSFPTSGLGPKGLDLSQLGLSSVDLRRGDAEMVSVLTALLQQYSNENRKGSRESSQRDPSDGRSFGRSHDEGKSPNFTGDPDQQPKFNVIKGFTLSDQQPEEAKSPTSGSASENTRYSKFKKKTNLENNSVTTSESDREGESYSASTNRKTVTPANDGKERRRDVNTYFPRVSALTGRSVSSGVRTNRHIHRKLFQDNPHGSDKSMNNEIEDVINVNPDKKQQWDKTTVLTMFMSGINPGEVLTTSRIVTLRGVTAGRARRHVSTPTSPVHPESITQTVLTPFIEPEEVVRLLKTLDKSKVQEMLNSLQKWVSYYVHEVLDKTEIKLSTAIPKVVLDDYFPHLTSSRITEEEIRLFQDATAELKSIPYGISGKPHPVTANACLKASTVTETVYETVTVNQ